MAGSLLEANLKRVVPGGCSQHGQSFEPTIKLRVGAKQVCLRDLVVDIAGIGDVGRIEGRSRWTIRCGRSDRYKEALERIRHQRVQEVAYRRIVRVMRRIE